MSKVKSRDSGVCADCSAPDPGWASINRGVLVCDECCSVHRSLGRHISHVKSLRKGIWNPYQLQMVHLLVSLGANNIWEHTLLDPGQSSSKQVRRKPNPHDPLHPTKAEFIRAKYLVLAFSRKVYGNESSSIDDLNQQLHSCVRTSNLEISLRLLSQGADPNVIHTERGNFPLHVAAQSGQAAQVELLVLYGADPGAEDVAGRTAIDCAKAENYMDIAERLVECEFELTDRLSYYLCGRKPDHAKQDFIIPQMADTSLDVSEPAKNAKKKLRSLPNRMFEELAMDVFDEVDRRENDAIWLSTQSHSTLITDRQSVPFLPVNPELSATRNQGRQKLARFNAREFATLVIDILMEAKRRQLGLNEYPGLLPSPVSDPRGMFGEQQQHNDRVDNMNRSFSDLSDDEPLYDEVATEDDYSPIGPSGKNVRETGTKKREQPKKAENNTDEATSKNSNESLTANEVVSPVKATVTIPADEFNEVKKSLSQSEAKVQQMALVNRELKQEVTKLHCQVTQLIEENQCLKTRKPEIRDDNLDVVKRPSQSLVNKRPQSMFESRDVKKPILKKNNEDRSNVVESVREAEDPEYDKVYQETSPAVKEEVKTRSMPSQDEVVRKTERITKKIQELLISAQEGKHPSYISCSDRIYAAVNEMAAIFPQKPPNDPVGQALQALTTSAHRLKEECRNEPEDSRGQVDHRLKTQQVIQCAYDIAKAAKQLVTLFQ